MPDGPMLSNFCKTLKLSPSWLQRPLTQLPVMDRYIIAELTLPFLFGVGAFTAFSISVGTVFELVRKVTEDGLPLGIAFKVFLLQLPHFTNLALPMSVLLASLMTYSRLSSDSELTALQSCGVSLRRLIVPTLLFSIIVMGLSFGLSEFVVPEANYEATLTLEQVLRTNTPNFQRENILYREFRRVQQPDGTKDKILARLFMAKRFDGWQMYGLTVVDFSRHGLSQITAAESAIWNPSGNRWDFFDGTIYLVAADGSYRSVVHFDEHTVRLSRAPLDLAQRRRDYDEMTIAQAQDYLDLLHLEGDEEKLRKLEIRIQQKYAFPFICLVFGLVGATLGAQPQRRGRATSFGISILIIFGYYLMAFILSSFGQLGILTPLMAAWSPNLIGLGVGTLLLNWASR